MSLWVCTTATDDQLTTTSVVKNLLGITTTSNDSMLNTLITVASRWAESRVGYPLILQSYGETLAGYGRRRMLLTATPVRAVDTLWDATSTATATQIKTSEFRIENALAGSISRDRGFEWSVPSLPLGNVGLGGGGLSGGGLQLWPAPGDEIRPWWASYRAGFTYGGLSTSSAHWSTEAGTTSTGRTLPDDIEQAVAQRVVALFQGVDSDVVASEQLGDLRVNYRSAGPDDRLSYESLLEPYVRVS